VNNNLRVLITLFLCSIVLAADNPEQTPVIKKTNGTSAQPAKKAAKKTTPKKNGPDKKETAPEEIGQVAADIPNEKFDPKRKQKEVTDHVEKGNEGCKLRLHSHTGVYRG